MTIRPNALLGSLPSRTANTRVFTLEARLTRDTERQLALVLAQQNRYRNTLVELYRRAAVGYQETRRGFSPRLAELDEEIGVLEEERQRLKRRQEKLAPDQRAELAALTAEAKPLRTAFNVLLAPANAALTARYEALLPDGAGAHTKRKVRRQVLAEMLEEDWPDEWKHVTENNMALRDALRDARRASELRDSFYRPPEDGLDAGKRAAGAAHVPFIPRFSGSDGQGTVAVQMRGKHAKTAIGEGPLELSTFEVEIKPLEYQLPEKHRHPRPERDGRSKRPRKSFYAVGMRVSKEAGKEWIGFTVMAHRPIPNGALTWVKLLAKRRGARLRYQLQFVIESEHWERKPPATEQAVAVHLGWASLGDGTYRVGYSLTEGGERDELVLDMRESTDKGERRDLHGIEKSEGIRAAQDMHFNAARAELCAWLRQKPALAAQTYTVNRHDGAIQTCLREECKSAAQWRAPWRLRRAAGVLARLSGVVDELPALWDAWQQERVAAGFDRLGTREEAEAFATERGVDNADARMAFYLHIWSRKSWHLVAYERDERDQATRRRRDVMRKWARMLERSAALAVVADWDLTQLPSATKKRDDESKQMQNARKSRTACAPGELRQIVTQAFGSGRIKKPTAGEHAQRCAHCGLISRPHAGSLLVTCACGHTEDRSERWCRNVLAALKGREVAA